MSPVIYALSSTTVVGVDGSGGIKPGSWYFGGGGGGGLRAVPKHDCFCSLPRNLEHFNSCRGGHGFLKTIAKFRGRTWNC